ncbi:hypothetical protein AGMMS49545_14260 [Betaproteobacteria bacterium]|nr:hypothetical protein AGMMS49545_14260 [Betaproteobacteria bacterium]GHU45805.1 hypothetical protein AGMMS50289_17740 [Betaproteobacteria bacterium]
MSDPELSSFIILGLTNQGKKFRPSDWSDRLSGILSAFRATKKMQYSPYVSPGDYNGEKAVYVDGALRDLEPTAYAFLLDFARNNDLQIINGVCPVPPVS